MTKTAVIYWSGTGNTKTMAEQIAKYANAELIEVSQAKANDIDKFNAIAFGCPSMGAEVLEEEEFAPFFNQIAHKLKGKKIALFGSYGWGDGEWMRNWYSQCEELGANMLCNYLICEEAPNSEVLEACKELGETLNKA